MLWTIGLVGYLKKKFSWKPDRWKSVAEWVLLIVDAMWDWKISSQSCYFFAKDFDVENYVKVPYEKKVAQSIK